MNKKLVVLTMFFLFGGVRSWGMGSKAVKHFQQQYDLKKEEAVALIEMLDSSKAMSFMGFYDEWLTSISQRGHCKGDRVWTIAQSPLCEEKLQKIVNVYKTEMITTPHGVNVRRYFWTETLQLEQQKRIKGTQEIDAEKAKILGCAIRNETDNGHLKMVKEIVEKEGLDFYSKSFEYGPLFYICDKYPDCWNPFCGTECFKDQLNGQLKIIEYLVLQKGLDVNKPAGPEKMTLLYMACDKSPDLLTLLIEKCGAQIDKKTARELAREFNKQLAENAFKRRLLFHNVLPYVPTVPVERLPATLNNKKSKKDCTIKMVNASKPATNEKK